MFRKKEHVYFAGFDFLYFVNVVTVETGQSRPSDTENDINAIY